ncbi:MAG: DNA recombination protein RmuC [Acidobacteriaceae bacterium]
MDTIVIVSLSAISCLLLLVLLLQMRKLSQLTAKAIDLSLVLTRIDWLQTLREQADRSVREDAARGRQEQMAQSQALRSDLLNSLAGMGDSVSGKLDGFTRVNDQRVELLRTAIAQRIDSFTSESVRKADGLTQSAAALTASLQETLSSRLHEFKSLLDGAVMQSHNLQGQQADNISSTIRALQAGIDRNMLQMREEAGTLFKNHGDTVLSMLTGISQMQKTDLAEIRATVDGRLATIQVENERKLEQMRQTVDEKLQGTLEARLGESFRQVSDRLEQVYSGLGEMKNLASGVGDLKRVLSNVRTHGTWGEVQLGAIIEEILAPDQFRRNVATTGSVERVDFAVRLPGREGHGDPVWLPIDASFPLEDYQNLLYASELGDAEATDRASRQLESTLRASAMNISDKYLAPPGTTDFAIMFLPTEGLYAEVMRRPGLADSIQREHRVVLAGPSTVAALLNALQMGFRTLAIERRSSEVWETLGSVKIEFGKYAEVLARVKKKLSEAQNTIDTAETRTRAIQRRLRDVNGKESPELAHEILAQEAGLDAIPILSSNGN